MTMYCIMSSNKIVDSKLKKIQIEWNYGRLWDDIKSAIDNHGRLQYEITIWLCLRPPPPAHIESYKYEQDMIVFKMIRYNILHVHNIMLNNNLTQKTFILQTLLCKSHSTLQTKPNKLHHNSFRPKSFIFEYFETRS